MTQVETSAGGVIYRPLDGAGYEVCLITCRGKGRWQLPKGWVEPGETREQAAVREVHEETGLLGTIELPLETIDFFYAARYAARPERRHKFVHHFLLRFVEGDTSGHDHEVDEARWFPLADALRVLAFDNERQVMKRAAGILGKKTPSTDPLA